MYTRSIIVLLSVTALCASSFAFAQGRGANPNGKPFVALQGQIIEVEGEISSLQDQVDALVGRVDSLEEDQQATQAAIASLQEQNAALSDQIQANADDVTSLQAETDALEEENDALQAQIDANSGDIAAAQAQIATNEGLISSMQQTLSELGTNLQDQIDHNEALIGVMQSNLANLAVELEMKQNLIDGKCADGSAIREVLADGSVICEQDDVGTNIEPTIEVINGSHEVGPGETDTFRFYCPPEFRPISIGYIAYEGHVYQLLANPSLGGAGVMKVENRDSYSHTYHLYVTCMKFLY